MTINPPPSLELLNKQLIEARRALGRVAMESGSTNSDAVKAVRAHIDELMTLVKEAEAAKENEFFLEQRCVAYQSRR